MEYRLEWVTAGGAPRVCCVTVDVANVIRDTCPLLCMWRGKDFKELYEYVVHVRGGTCETVPR